MQAVLIAAGRSSRFWPFNEDHKSTFSLLGQPLLRWTLESLAFEAGVEEAVVVHAPHSNIPTLIPPRIGEMTVSFVVQEQPLGTGNALQQARGRIRGTFALVWPDMVNAGSVVARMREQMEGAGAQGAILGAPTKRPWEFGILEVQKERLVRVVEKPQRGSEPSDIKRVGVELFGADFFDTYERLKEHHETDLVDAINEYAAAREVIVCENRKDVPVLKYPWDVFVAQNLLFSLYPGVHTEGADIADSVVLQGNVFVGAGARIGEGVQLQGPLSIGANAIVEEGSVLSRCVVGEGAVVRGAHLEDSVVGEGCVFASGVRAENEYENGGVVQATVKGERIETGRSRLGAMVGARSSFEVRCSTRPGVLVGRDVAIGAGVVVSENIEDGQEVLPRIDNE